LLKRYNGTNTEVNVYGSYVVNGTSYSAKLTPCLDTYLFGSHKVCLGTFNDNTDIKYVNFLGKVTVQTITYSTGKAQGSNSYGGADGMFAKCTSLKMVTGLENVYDTDWTGMFLGCTSLTVASDIPEFVELASRMYENCTSLGSLPKIAESSSLVEMTQMFSGCTNIKSGSFSIPASVKSVDGLFENCKSMGTTGMMKVYADKVDYSQLDIATKETTKIFYDTAYESSYLGGLRFVVNKNDLEKWQKHNSGKVIITTE